MRSEDLGVRSEEPKVFEPLAIKLGIRNEEPKVFEPLAIKLGIE